MTATQPFVVETPVAAVVSEEKKHDSYLVSLFGLRCHAVCVVHHWNIFESQNIIVLLMAIELMLLAVNTNFVAFSHYLGDMHGQIFVFLS